jgi:sn-glycerol 3-phosphate transport system substrate-binding protein
MKAPQNSIIGGASNWVLKGHTKEEYEGVAAFLEFLANNDMQDLLAQGNRLFSHHPDGL